MNPNFLLSTRHHPSRVSLARRVLQPSSASLAGLFGQSSYTPPPPIYILNLPGGSLTWLERFVLTPHPVSLWPFRLFLGHQTQLENLKVTQLVLCTLLEGYVLWDGGLWSQDVKSWSCDGFHAQLFIADLPSLFPT